MSEVKRFNYNLSFYYQSTIVYLIVFLLYVILKGSFTNGNFMVITEDAIMFLLAIIVFISIASLLYNWYKKKYLEIDDDGIRFGSRFKTRYIKNSDILEIRIPKRKTPHKKNVFRLIIMKIKNRRRRIVLRPYDYENESELIKRFEEKMESINTQNV
jgi:hypothetical protein